MEVQLSLKSVEASENQVNKLSCDVQKEETGQSLQRADEGGSTLLQLLTMSTTVNLTVAMLLFIGEASEQI